ncbi:hypothetical protein WMY93_033463 [Mugilogobius chulae]|uniref:Uncharacterized protein n=1 Tax=Mugilogobius chulae TaxID=88201 RepID=A0AAW0ML43_9GOBI
MLMIKSKLTRLAADLHRHPSLSLHLSSLSSHSSFLNPPSQTRLPPSSLPLSFPSLLPSSTQTRSFSLLALSSLLRLRLVPSLTPPPLRLVPSLSLSSLTDSLVRSLTLPLRLSPSPLFHPQTCSFCPLSLPPSKTRSFLNSSLTVPSLPLSLTDSFLKSFLQTLSPSQTHSFLNSSSQTLC